MPAILSVLSALKLGYKQKKKEVTIITKSETCHTDRARMPQIVWGLFRGILPSFCCFDMHPPTVSGVGRACVPASPRLYPCTWTRTSGTSQAELTYTQGTTGSRHNTKKEEKKKRRQEDLTVIETQQTSKTMKQNFLRPCTRLHSLALIMLFLRFTKCSSYLQWFSYRLGNFGQRVVIYDFVSPLFPSRPFPLFPVYPPPSSPSHPAFFILVTPSLRPP